ncbi:MAG TPA: hypothetical protein VN986_04970, partial [Actinomycetota bacterium]|nr:hypothetical protein [Actinomycetota bacterium]
MASGRHGNRLEQPGQLCLLGHCHGLAAVGDQQAGVLSEGLQGRLLVSGEGPARPPQADVEASCHLALQADRRGHGGSNPFGYQRRDHGRRRRIILDDDQSFLLERHGPDALPPRNAPDLLGNSRNQPAGGRRDQERWIVGVDESHRRHGPFAKELCGSGGDSVEGFLQRAPTRPPPLDPRQPFEQPVALRQRFAVAVDHRQHPGDQGQGFGHRRQQANVLVREGSVSGAD